MIIKETKQSCKFFTMFIFSMLPSWMAYIALKSLDQDNHVITYLIYYFLLIFLFVSVIITIKTILKIGTIECEEITKKDKKELKKLKMICGMSIILDIVSNLYIYPIFLSTIPKLIFIWRRKTLEKERKKLEIEVDVEPIESNLSEDDSDLL